MDRDKNTIDSLQKEYLDKEKTKHLENLLKNTNYGK